VLWRGKVDVDAMLEEKERIFIEREREKEKGSCLWTHLTRKRVQRRRRGSAAAVEIDSVNAVQ